MMKQTKILKCPKIRCSFTSPDESVMYSHIALKHRYSSAAAEHLLSRSKKGKAKVRLVGW